MRRDTDNKGQEKEKPSRTVFLAMFPLKQLLHAKVRVRVMRVRWYSCACAVANLVGRFDREPI